MSIRAAVFRGAVVLTLGLAALFSGMVVLMNLAPGLMGMAHFAEHSHRVHDLAFALLVGTTVTGMLAQLRAPARNMASQLLALIPFAALLVSTLLSNPWVLAPPWLLVGAGAVLAAMFHPIGDPLRAFGPVPPHRPTLALVAVAAGPLLAYAFANLGLQRGSPTDHVLLGHYGYMAALSLTIVAASALAGGRAEGWRLVAWVAGALAAALGVISILYADVDSKLPLPWALAALTWGVLFVAVTERSRSTGSDSGAS